MKALELCGGHWFRLKHSGSVQPDKPLKGFRAPFERFSDEHGPFIRLPLTKGQFALIDESDIENVIAYKWYVSIKPGSTGLKYARAFIPGMATKQVFMHCFILGAVGIDHKDHDGLNNRRHNLRAATASQNLANTRKCVGTSSRFKGVTWDKARQCWCASMEVMGRSKFIGRFTDEVMAAKAYDSAAKLQWGEFSFSNF